MRDILDRMSFRPIVHTPRPMRAEIFQPEVMKLDALLLHRSIGQRMEFDDTRNTLFLNLEAYRVHTHHDVEVVRKAVMTLSEHVGRRISAIINYDAIDIAPHMADAWFLMAAEVEAQCYDHVSRYSTSAFMRLKLGAALADRVAASHIFESPREADMSLRHRHRAAKSGA